MSGNNNQTTWLEDMFKDGQCVITVIREGETKVAVCEKDQSCDPKDLDGLDWKTLPQDDPEDEDPPASGSGVYKEPFKEVVYSRLQYHIGFYFIKDLHDMKKANSYSEKFISNGVPFSRVILSARIQVVEKRDEDDDHYRLAVHDGTASILCVVNLPTKAPKTFKYRDVVFGLENNREVPIYFDKSSVGRYVKIIGHLKEFLGKKFIYCYNIRWVTVEFHKKFAEHIAASYVYKKNFATY
ncbi:uncharacterized protein LOC115891438 [Sitophilus oryzae]|uniref:Uncharacterized protein LOC115891438 n=1 Tax=Sitophilus oryzae TaxID=7048 RepID=A0A6J2YWX7_SITOR|nr:uncharacterized protein LOC115891438 [Sitophilus oryzae]XP_030767749.1 uncharacterized protein LOC115891438 [Sitophilus oryzae]XP_030767750.1 uncharacterized protein LOC115891438 [Sitophilus oryzae]